MKKILGIVLGVALVLSIAAPSLAAGPKEPSKGDQKGIIAALIERALEGGKDPSVYVDVQDSPVHTDDVVGPDNFQEYVVYTVLNHEPADVPEDDERLPVLASVRGYIQLTTPYEKQAELFAYQYCEEHEIEDPLVFEEDDDLFFDLVYALAEIYGIDTP